MVVDNLQNMGVDKCYLRFVDNFYVVVMDRRNNFNSGTFLGERF